MAPSTLFPIRLDEPAAKAGHAMPIAAEWHLFRHAADCAFDGVLISRQSAGSAQPLVLYANPAANALLGRNSAPESANGAPPPISLIVDNPLWKSLKESHQTDGVFSSEIVSHDETGCKTILQLRSEPAHDEFGQVSHRIAILRDVSHQSHLEETVRQNERLACIGLLAAGIAHEINNPTGSALLAAETALAIMNSPQSGEQMVACLRNIVTSMDRCGRIVRTLLRYSREEPSERQACNINDVAEQSLELARPYAERHGAELRLDLDPDLPLAPMNPLEIELVLVNLIRNAVEAGRGNTVITIRTGPAQGGVLIAVSDNGCGMNKEQLAHVFDPLYTTRRQVGGSGLGMSIAYGIVQKHEGHMEVQSQLGSGTTVTIDLPVPTSL